MKRLRAEYARPPGAH